jgi:glycosyltransferase involved in cell wall biosynthesis
VRRPGPVRAFEDEPFDVVHVFRLATVEHVRPWLGAGRVPPARHLDLDDVESTTRRRIAALADLSGQSELAEQERAAAARAVAAEADVLRVFHRVYVCSDGDRAALEGRRVDGAAGRIEVLPNALPMPAPLSPPIAASPFTFLFVGTLGYLLNEDAIVTFCRDALPRLRRMSPLPFRIMVAGTGAGPAIEALATIPEVDLLGAVPDIAACYARADAVVVPLRAGGGTRIKVLEAIAFRRPVVATTIGAEGIEARHDRHLLIADDPLDFARQCARLLVSPDLRTRLADQAEALFRERYSLDALIRRVQALP